MHRRAEAESVLYKLKAAPVIGPNRIQTNAPWVRKFDPAAATEDVVLLGCRSLIPSTGTCRTMSEFGIPTPSWSEGPGGPGAGVQIPRAGEDEYENMCHIDRVKGKAHSDQSPRLLLGPAPSIEQEKGNRLIVI
ncbi:hypothetical protein R1sor_017439 [Riccia sorocarpa]|uniref:Uncharacterized protein n=1 Tax=Riccia sorocarpa TaxID=122646 RepID=A0ABD3IAV7_9MARC